MYLYGVLDDDQRTSQLLTYLKMIIFQKPDRYLAYDKIKVSISGTSILTIPDTKEERLNIFTTDQGN